MFINICHATVPYRGTLLDPVRVFVAVGEVFRLAHRAPRIIKGRRRWAEAWNLTLKGDYLRGPAASTTETFQSSRLLVEDEGFLLMMCHNRPWNWVASQEWSAPRARVAVLGCLKKLLQEVSHDATKLYTEPIPLEKTRECAQEGCEYKCGDIGCYGNPLEEEAAFHELWGCVPMSRDHCRVSSLHDSAQGIQVVDMQIHSADHFFPNTSK